MKSKILALLLLLTFSITVLPFKSKQTKVEIIDSTKMSQLEGGSCEGAVTGVFLSALGWALFASPFGAIPGAAIAVFNLFSNCPEGGNEGSGDPSTCPNGGGVEPSWSCSNNGGSVMSIVGPDGNGGTNVCCQY